MFNIVYNMSHNHRNITVFKHDKQMATNNRGRIGLIGGQSKVSKYRMAAIKAAEAAGRKSELLWTLQRCSSWQSIVNVCKQRNLIVNFES